MNGTLSTCNFPLCTFFFTLAGHSTGQIASLIAFSFFKNENVKVKVKYGFVLHTGFAGSLLLL
jgi:hypothetical protein